MTVVTFKGIPQACSASKKILAGTLALVTTFGYLAPAALSYDYGHAQKVYVPASTYARESTVASASGITGNGSAPMIPTVHSSNQAVSDPGANRIHLQVQQLEKRNALDEAAHVLTNGLKMYPRDYVLLADLVNLNIKRVKKLALHHNYSAAAEIVRQNIYMNPGNAKLPLLLDDVLRESGVNPKDPIERTRIANLLLSERKLDDAEVEYDAALKLQPSAQAYVGLGIDKTREGQRTQARNDFEKALELDAAYAPAHRQMGLLYSSQGDVVGASAELSRATILDPTDKAAGNSLVELWHRQVNKNFNDVTSHFGLARAYVLTGDLKSAQSEYRQIVTMDPNNPNLPEARLSFKLALAHQEGARLLESARTYEAQGQLSAAMQKTMEGLHVDPSNVNLLTYKAYLFERTNQYNAARYGYMAVLKQDPNNTYANQRLQVLATATTSAAYAAMQGPPGMPGSNNLGLRGYSQPYPGAGEGPATPIAPPPPPQFDHVATISDLFWQIRGAAADDTIAVQKKEDTLMNMQNMYISLKKQGIDPMKLIAQMGSGGGGAGALTALMGAAGGAGAAGAAAGASAAPPGIPADIAAIVNGNTGHGSALGSAPPGLPPDIANIINGSHGSSSASPAMGLPPDIAAMIGGGAGAGTAPAAPAGLPPGASAMLSTLGLAKPDGSIDMGKISSYLAGAPLPPNLAAIVDSLGLRKPDGTLDLAKIMNMIGGGAGLAALTGGAAAAPAAPRASAPQASSGSGSPAGLPPDIAALLNNSGTPSVPSNQVKAKTASQVKRKIAAKKTNKNVKKTVHGQLAAQAPKTTVAAPATAPGLPAGMNLSSFMPVIQMAMQRFIDLENKTNKIGDQLQTTQQSIRELQQYIRGGGKLPAPLPQTGMAPADGAAMAAPITTSIQSPLKSSAVEMPPELTAPAAPASLTGSYSAVPATSTNAPPGLPADIANMIHAEATRGQLPNMAPPGMPMSSASPNMTMPSSIPPGMPMPTGQQNMSIPQSGPPGMPMPSAQPSTPWGPSSMTMPQSQPAGDSSSPMELAAKLAPPISAGSTRIQPNAPQLDWNSPPVPPQTSLTNTNLANSPSTSTASPLAQAPQAVPAAAGAGGSPVASLPDSALVGSAQVNVANAPAATAPPQMLAGIPLFTDPGGTSDQAQSPTDKKSAHQHKVRVEIEGVRPDILGIRVKFVIINEQNYAIPLPDNMDKLLKRLKVYMPTDAENVPPHGEVHGSVRVPIP